MNWLRKIRRVLQPFKVENAGFAEIAALEGTESDQRATATHYRAFMNETHRD